MSLLSIVFHQFIAFILYFIIFSKYYQFCRRITIPIKILQYPNKIFVAILTGSRRVPLLEEQYTAWIKDFLATQYCSEIRLYSFGQAHFNNTFLASIYVDTPKFEGDYSRDLLKSKTYQAIKDFNLTSSAWFLRLCDDTFINLNAFDNFFSELNKGVNPYEDRIIQGHCINKNKGYIYLQGGSGIIFSRAAVYNLLSTYQFVMNFLSHVKNDDTSLGIWLNRNNYSSYNNTNRFFVGHSFSEFQKLTDILNISKSSYIHPCPKHPQSSLCFHCTNCKNYITKLKNIVFWHDRARWFEFIPYARNFIANLPDNLYYYQVNKAKPRICYSNDSSIENYY